MPFGQNNISVNLRHPGKDSTKKH